MKNHLLKFILFALVLIGSCSKDENNNDTPTVSNTYSITLAGQINDENGQGIPNVTVQVGNKIDQTDGNGIYLIEKANVNKSRAVVKATKAGYWNRSSGFIPSNSTVQYCNLVMPQKAAASSIQSSVGGSVTSAGATVVFPVNAFVTSTGMTYNGTVNITSKHLPTSDPNFGALIPGGDLMAEDNASNSVKLISYGMIGVELTDNSGNPLQLGPGINATVQLPIASVQLSSAPTTIPLWYFDETKSLWIEEGLATKQGNNYVGQVGHFSWWNYDMSIPPATIEGYVFDCEGNPVQNAKIFSDNSGLLYTNQNGFYSGQIISGSSSTVKALIGGIFTNTLIIPTLAPGQIYSVPNLTFNCAGFGKLIVNFVDCNNNSINPTVLIATSVGNVLLVPQNGEVSALIPCGQNIFSALQGSAIYSSVYTQLCNPDSNDLGTIILCDTTNTQGLSFSFDLTSPSTNITYNNPQYFSGEYYSSSNQMHISALTSSPGQSLDGYIEGFSTYLPGTYTQQNFPYSILNLEYTTTSYHYFIYADTITPNLTYTILKNGAVGDTMEVMISGNIFIEQTASSTIEYGVLNSLYIKCIRTQ